LSTGWDASSARTRNSATPPRPFDKRLRAT
jgi:hypothetical protein